MRHFGLFKSSRDDYSDKELLTRDSFMSIDTGIGGVGAMPFSSLFLVGCTAREWREYLLHIDFFELRSSPAAQRIKSSYISHS